MARPRGGAVGDGRLLQLDHGRRGSGRRLLQLDAGRPRPWRAGFSRAGARSLRARLVPVRGAVLALRFGVRGVGSVGEDARSRGRRRAGRGDADRLADREHDGGAGQRPGEQARAVGVARRVRETRGRQGRAAGDRERDRRQEQTAREEERRAAQGEGYQQHRGRETTVPEGGPTHHRDERANRACRNDGS